MLLYLLSLFASLILTSVVIMLLTKCLTVNWERKNRHRFSYVMPVILTVILLYLSLTLTMPRLLDSLAVLTDQCPVEEVHMADASIGSMTLQIGDRVLHYNPRQFTFLAEQTVRLKYTPRSRFILEVKVIE